jgi:hypothetical protein
MEGQTTVYGKPFPLVLVPKGKVNHVLLQEYFLAHREDINKAASEYGAVMFKGFDLASGEDFASVLHKTGLKQI